MAPNQTRINTYYKECKGPITRSQKTTEQLFEDEKLNKDEDVLILTPKEKKNWKAIEATSESKLEPFLTPKSKNRGKNGISSATKATLRKETPSLAKNTKLLEKFSSNRDLVEDDRDNGCVPLVLEKDSMSCESNKESPTKRRNKTTKGEPCSPPKIKCYDGNEDASPRSKNLATPSTLLQQLTLVSPLAADKSRSSLPPKSLFPEPVDLLSKARVALHTHTQTSLPEREGELSKLQGFIRYHIESKTSGSLYISGPPGTGKTACLVKVLEESNWKDYLSVVNINCTSVESPKTIYSRIVQQLNLHVKGKSCKAYLEVIKKYFELEKKMLLLVLDEMDQLNTRSQTVLYTIFEWPMTYPNGLILIGIANALDLTDRLLPRLKAKLQLAPQLLHFAPYTREQLLNILIKRLEEANASKVFRPGALQLLASKLSAVNGDARRALDTARRAVERESQKLFDAKMNSQHSESPTKPDILCFSLAEPLSAQPQSPCSIESISSCQGKEKQGSPRRVPLNSPRGSPLRPVSQTSAFKSPTRQSSQNLPSSIVNLSVKENCSPHQPRSAKKSLNFGGDSEGKKLSIDVVASSNTAALMEPSIDILSVMNVVNDVYGMSQNFGQTGEGAEEFPLHQKLAVCSLLLMLREGKTKDVTVGKLHDVYRRVCLKRHLDPLDFSAFLSILGLIEARGILLLPGRGNRNRFTKVCMQWIEEEVASAVKDKNLLSAILMDKACLH